MVKCTSCGRWACSSGELEKLPTQGFCPMVERKEVLAKAREIYKDSKIRKISQESARVEATGYCEWTRVQETMEFAQRMGVTKLGIAYCIGLKRIGRAVVCDSCEDGFAVLLTLHFPHPLDFEKAVRR